jgi:hypothetical protein
MSPAKEAIRKLEVSRNTIRLALSEPEASSSPVKLALTAGNLVMQPAVRKHPFRAVLGAALIGALLVKGRPWRLLANPVVVSALLPLALTKVGTESQSTGPLLIKALALYRQFLQGRTKSKLP